MTARVRRAVAALATLARSGWQCSGCGGWQPGDIPPVPQHCNNCR
ncbi:hypothetical protein [Streptomyces carpaticus]|uniref:Uncharacterized protein n=1 Tax=Streptomyces carpaticus TaxID=285558 RepID=A0ABV4ZUC8_9ACTN